ncbi:MAG: hypothetical protein AAF224_04065 [Pseudomonadota bacterium]
MKKAIVIAALASGLVVAGPASAGTSDQIAMCLAALDEGGEVNTSDYEPRFKGVRGGGLKRLSLELAPVVDGGDTLEAECKIRRGEVVDIEVKA